MEISAAGAWLSARMRADVMRLMGIALALVAGLLGASLPARADVLVGVAGPMAGSFANAGRDIAAGVDIAIAAVNARGGLDGQKLKAVVVDDKCDGETATALANQLVGKGVRLVIGHPCTAAALPAARVYADNNVLFIAVGASNPRLTDEVIGPSVLRLAIRSDLEGPAIGDYLASHFAGKRVAFVHDGGVYGQSLVEAAAKRFAAAGGAVAMTESFTPGERSQNKLIGHIQDAAVTAVVLGALQADAAVIVAELKARGLDVGVVGTEALGLEEFRALAGSLAEQPVFMLPRVDRNRPEAVDLLVSLEDRGLQPTDMLFTAHAALEAATAALKGGATAAAAGKTLRKGQLATVIGPVGFDAKGDWTDAAYAPCRWRGDSLVQ
jgi:branched-chain amino acid transport system substrate-binding protein